MIKMKRLNTLKITLKKINKMEQEIKIAAKLYQCRDTAKKLFKDEFNEKISWYKEKIIKAKEDLNMDVLETVLELCNIPSVKENGMALMLFMAAAVEILEPSKD
jgi:hypothetical protein